VPIEKQVAELFKEMILAINIKENLIVDLDGSFRGIKHQRYLKSRGVKTPEM
jgi:hypothetical protein